MKSSPNDVELTQSEQSFCTGSEVTGSGTDGNSESHSDETDFLVFKDHGLRGLIGWLTGLQHSVGHKLLVLLVAVQHILKGAGCTLAWKSTSYLYKQYHLPAQQVQILNAVVGLPWVLKPIVGLASDVCPIKGYRKAPYMAVASIIGVGACLVIGLLPSVWMPVHVLVGCLFLFQNQVTTTDLLTEALWAERLQAIPSLGPDLLTFVFAGSQVSCIVAVVASGFLIEYMGAQAVFICIAVLACSPILPLSLGYTEESLLTTEAVAALRQKFMKHKEACALAVVMLACAVCICITAMVSCDPTVNAAVSCLAAAVVLVTFSLVLSPVIAKFAAFSLIQTSMSLSVAGPAFYFLTDTPEEYPEGPHFSTVFFNTVLGAVGGICSLLGFYTYHTFSAKITYRSLLVSANVALSLLHLCDVLLFSRVNLRIGLADHVFVIGGAVLGPVISQWHWMPQVGLFSSLCPKDMEATMFALIVGCHNLGVSVASSAGGMLLQALGCNPHGAPGDGEQLRRLWIASGISSLLPLLSVLLLFWLVPDGRQGERPQGEGLDATAGSPWRRLAQAE
mmetsp:Transcript_20799/g.58592  ORF Transcript_20799/g.58592 Transcript_20799/m.58592 type:complete len:563 (+) Transcript_20799:194-1882(+)